MCIPYLKVDSKNAHKHNFNIYCDCWYVPQGCELVTMCICGEKLHQIFDTYYEFILYIKLKCIFLESKYQ